MEEKIAESQEALTKGSWKDFFSVDKMMDWGMNLAGNSYHNPDRTDFVENHFADHGSGSEKKYGRSDFIYFRPQCDQGGGGHRADYHVPGSSGHSGPYDRGCYRGRPEQLLRWLSRTVWLTLPAVL